MRISREKINEITIGISVDRIEKSNNSVALNRFRIAQNFDFMC